MTPRIPGSIGLTLFLVACHGAPRATALATIDRAGSASAPMDLERRASSNWEYLLAKYDRDGDGRIARLEYGRDDERFARLDLDADGVLSARDLSAPEASPLRAYYRERRALRVLATYFQADDEDDQLRLDELEWMTTAYDADLDQAVDAAEFAAGCAQYRRAIEEQDASGTQRVMMGEYDPWTVLCEVVDEDGDERLAAAELVAFFHAASRGGEVLGLREEETVAPDTSGVPEGEPAPDFSLEPPAGGARVTLSSFRGKPVALIFGSYT